MSILILEKSYGAWEVTEYGTYASMIEAMLKRTIETPAATLYKAKNGDLIIFEGKRRATEEIVRDCMKGD